MPGAVILNPVVPVGLVDHNGVPLQAGLFGETRVVPPYTIVDLINKYYIDPNYYGTLTATGGTVTHIPAQQAIRLAVTTTNGSSAKLRTHLYFRYQAGKTTRIRMSIYNADSGQSNQSRRWGVFDDNDGLFFALSSSTLQVVTRSSTSGSAVDTAVNQGSWNVDKMDGTGPSGITIDVTKGNMYEIAYQWLGVGTTQFMINGYLVHEIIHANTLSVPYMGTGQLPLSWEVVNTGASTVSSLTYICGSVISEGGASPPPNSFGAYNSSDISVTSTERPVLSIRPKLSFNSVTNRMLILPILMFISTEGSRISYRLVMNSVLTGPSWSSVDSDSGTEFDVVSTSGTGGVTLVRGFLAGNNDGTGPFDLSRFFSDSGAARNLSIDAFATTQDVLTIYATNQNTGNTLVRGSFTWLEVR